MATIDVNVGFPPTSDVLPVFVARDMGFFRKHGLEVTLTRLPIIAEIPSFLITGGLQIGLVTVPILLKTTEGGLDIVAIAGASRMRKDNPTASLVTRTRVKGVRAWLRGKRVAIPALNSALHLLFLKWLIEQSVPLEQVIAVEITFAGMKDALKNGTVDAALAIEPFRGDIVADNTGYRVADFVAELEPDILAVLFAAKREWANQNPQAVRGFRDAYDEAIEYCRLHPEETRLLQLKYLGASSPVVPSFSTELRRADLEYYVEITRELGMLKGPVNVANLIAP